jgi:hypothetical protein
VLQPPAVVARLEATVAVVAEQQQHGGQQYQSVTLLVENQRRSVGSSSAAARGSAEVSLTVGGLPGQVIWTDRTPEQVRGRCVSLTCCTHVLCMQLSH